MVRFELLLLLLLIIIIIIIISISILLIVLDSRVLIMINGINLSMQIVIKHKVIPEPVLVFVLLG